MWQKAPRRTKPKTKAKTMKNEKAMLESIDLLGAMPIAVSFKQRPLNCQMPNAEQNPLPEPNK